MRKKLAMCLLMIFTVTTLLVPVYAKENPDTKPGIVSRNEETGVMIYRDAAGGLVFDGLSVPFTASSDLIKLLRE